MLSRVADTLYWMSRYLERAEHTARVIDVNLNLMLDQSPELAAPRWDRVLLALRASGPDTLQGNDAYTVCRALTFDPSIPASIVSSIARARENARQVRELISSEMWEQLNRLFFHVRKSSLEDIWTGQPHDFFQAVKEGAHLFQGITDSTMTRGDAYQFIEVGRYIERAGALSALLDVHFSRWRDPTGTLPLEVGEHFEWIGLLRCCTAFEAYCKVYTADLHPDRIAEFLLLNPEFPHSVRFAVDRLKAALEEISEDTGSRTSGRLDRLAGRLAASLSFGQIDEILVSGLHSYLEELLRQCGQIHHAIHQCYIAYPIESALEI